MWKAELAFSAGVALSVLLRWCLGIKLEIVFSTIPQGRLVAKLTGGCVIGAAMAYLV